MELELELLITSMGGRPADERVADEEPSPPAPVRSKSRDGAIATFLDWARDGEKV
jgi:hypothetical protein